MNKTLADIIQALRDFDKHESLLHHEQLEICIPQGFYRYAGVDSDPGKNWDSIDIRLIYCHRELQFSVSLMERSHAPNFAIVKHQIREAECVTEYRVTESANLTIRDAKRLLVFLQSYFRGFDFNLKTKLPKLATQTLSGSTVLASLG
jgi:hypothetical protein